MHKKMEKLLAANNIDARKAEILNVSNGIVLVEIEGKKYKLTGTKKELISEEIVKEKPYQNITKTKTPKPRGWHFRPVYVDSEGNVYHKGVIQPELKGTLDPTP